MSRGIFGLNEAYNEQVSGDWSTASDVWLLASPELILSKSPYGYFGGGHTPDAVSTVDRIDYSNDTSDALSRGTLSNPRGNLAAVSSSSAAYFVAGQATSSSTKYSIIDRLDYANDTAAATPKGPLAREKYASSGVNNASYAYISGGVPQFYSEIYRIDFANDTATASSRCFATSGGLYFGANTGNANYGYLAWGVAGSKIDRIDYSNDTATATAKGPLSAGSPYRYSLAATGNSNFGYWIGGYPGPRSNVDRLEYANDTAGVVVRNNLSPSVSSGRGFGATSHESSGYLGGSNPLGSHVRRIDFDNDTSLVLSRGPLSSSRFGTHGASASAHGMSATLQGAASNIGVNRVPVGTDFGYTFGGYKPSPGYLSAVQRIDYSSDTSTAPQTASLPNAMSNRATVGNTNYAYVQPGTGPAGTNMQRFDYSNDTSGTSAKGGVPKGHSNYNTGNEDFGYFSVEHPETSVFRLEYANDTANALVRTYRTVSNQIYNGGAAGNSSYGYFAGGGQNGTAGGTVMDRIDYSNDTATMTVKGPLTSNQTYGIAANGSANFAYWGGGDGGTGPTPGTRSTVDRLDYSSDTTATVAKGPLTTAKQFTGSTTNTSHGYWTGGGTAGITTVDRLDYSSDTTACATKGPLTFGSLGHGAGSSRENNLPTENIYSTTVSNSEEVSGTKVITRGNNFGYFAGGNGFSTVDRLDYGSDTTAAAPKGPLTSSGNLAGTSTLNYGYISGGDSAVDRIDYSNDTATALARSYITSGRTYISAVGNKDYGYWCGGTLSKTSTVDRVDYANDTTNAVEKGYLATPSLATSGAGNADYGYIGSPTPAKSSFQRIDYSNDTATALERGSLSSAGYMTAATGNANFGYWGGGPATGSKVERLDYANDLANAAFKGNVTSPKNNKRSATGSSDFGYIGGGNPSPVVSIVDRIDYSNDTSDIVARGPLSVARFYLAAVSSQENGLEQQQFFTISTPFAFGNNPTVSYPYGYYGDGNNYNTLVERIDYANDNTAPSRRGYLSAGGGVYVGGVASLNHGYFTGGDVHPNTVISRVERVDFSNDMVLSSIRGPLSTVRVGTMATGTKDFGYVGGGNDAVPGSSHTTTVDRINYANDTSTASPRGPLNESTNYGGATGNPSFGYFGGGTNKSLVNRLDYSNDTVAAAEKGPLSAAGSYQSATGNKDFGYWHGSSPGAITTVDRVDYANDTAVASVRGPLNTGRYRHGATGNTTQGYIIGGQPGTITTIERIDYSNDTAKATFVAPILGGSNSLRGAFSSQANALPQAFSQGYVGSYGAGYFGGGYVGPITSLVDRVDYGNDTVTASPRGPLSLARYALAATSSSSHGYFGGGGSGSPGGTTVDRVDYSNDTPTAAAKGQLSAARSYVAATGNVNFGYFAAGYPVPTTTVDRVDYGNDTPTAVAKGPLSVGRYALAATGNASYGYFGGGQPGPVSTVDRIDYNNDTPTTPTKGPLSSTRTRLSATGNASYGYFGGGSPGPVSTVDRIDYSSDTVTASPKGPLSATRNNLAATGNASYGYVGGGAPGSKSTVERIDYSSDTIVGSTKGPLSAARYSLAAVSARANALPIVGSTVSGFTNTVTRQYYPSSQRVYMMGLQFTEASDGNNIAEVYNIATSTTVANTRMVMKPAHNYKAASNSTPDYGYIGGNSPANIERIDYANDGSSPSPKGALASTAYSRGSAGNTTFGYWAGGGPSPSDISTVERLDYGNDTVAAVAKGPLAAAKSYLAGCGNRNFGYMNGKTPGGSSTVDRIDYSNDTATPIARDLIPASKGRKATGNADFGYFMGGEGTNPTGVFRLDYAADTTTMSPRGPLSQSHGRLASASGNKDFGIYSYGFPNTTSAIDRIDFSNDTATSVGQHGMFQKGAGGTSVCGGMNALPQ